ncbi:alpha/beta hydrolase [Flavobacterium sp. MK4S-17]|uniref:alpha/beta hydrolase n=1 Tax=Flavobacterium sp. MK4S-17 TaxID=2543737 RepID=UPI00135C1C23|nr:alpha/beta hydrolase [Flavobacterium sp. MK4S-17]
MENPRVRFEENIRRVYQKAVLSAHGWIGYAGNSCDLMNLFPDHEFTLITFDAPAHNASTGKSTNVFQIIRVCGLLIENYKPDFIIGHFMGSAVAVPALASAKYQNTKKLIL